MTIVRHIIDPATGQAFFVTPDNPSTIGLDGPIGSLANMAGGGRLFSKFGSSVTDWQEFAPVTTGGVVNSVFGRTGNVTAQSGDYTFAQIGSKPTTIGGYGITDFNSLGDARWLQKTGGTLTGALTVPSLVANGTINAMNIGLAGNTNPYIGLNDGSYVGYLQMVGTYLQLYFAGANRIQIHPTQMLTYLYGEIRIGGGVRSDANFSGDVPRWRMSADGGSPSLARMEFGSDNSGYAFGLGKNVSGSYTELFRFFDNGEFRPLAGRNWTTSGWSRAIAFGSAMGIGWNIGTAYARWGMAANGDNFYLWSNGADDGSLSPLYHFSVNPSNGWSFYTAAEFNNGLTIPNGYSLYGRRATGNAAVTMLRYDSGTDDLSMILGGQYLRWRDTGAGVPMRLSATGDLDVLNSIGLGGVSLAYYSPSYNQLYRRDGVIGIYLGGADPTNYYDNDGHIFRLRSSAQLLNMVDGGITLYRNMYTQGYSVYLQTGFIGYDNEQFAALTVYIPHYGLRWVNTDYSSSYGPALVGGAYGGISWFVSGSERMRIHPTQGIIAYNNITAPNFVLSSDVRLKRDFQQIEHALGKLDLLTGYTFLHQKQPGKRLAGIVAQQVQPVLPEAVFTGEDGYLSVAYDALVPLLIEAVKELRGQVRALGGVA